VVVAIIEAARTGEEINIFITIGVGKFGAFGFVERDRERARIALNFGFTSIKKCS